MNLFDEVHRKRLETTKDFHISIDKLHLEVPVSRGAGYFSKLVQRFPHGQFMEETRPAHDENNKISS